MKKKLAIILYLLFPLIVHSQTWRVFGIDSISEECISYSNITIFNNVPWTKSSKLEGTKFTSVESPSQLFVCDLSKSDHRGNLWLIGSIIPDIWTTHGNAFIVYKYDGVNWFDYSPPKSFGYNNCNSLAIQDDSIVWFTTRNNGAYKYDGTKWKQYLDLSILKGTNYVLIDNNNTWFATDSGLVKFDGSKWTVFNETNSGLKSTIVNDLAIGKNGNLWLATGSSNEMRDTLTGKIVKFDGINWTYYKTFEYGQGSYYVKSIAIDPDGKIWAGTILGLTVFNGNKWEKFNYPQIQSENLQVLSIDFDENGTAWLGSSCGIWQFENETTSRNYPDNSIIKIFPNPAHSYVDIKISEDTGKTEIILYDINGSIVLRTITKRSNGRIDLTTIKRGTYFIYVKTDFTTIQNKLIIE
jgi:hypothetical protein